MHRLRIMVAVTAVLSSALLANAVCAQEKWTTLTVIEDVSKGVISVVDLGVKGKSQGDLTVWNEPLLDKSKKKIGSSNGFCIRTLASQFSECQWTLSMADGSLTMAGREDDKGKSKVAVIGGTGAYAGVTGENDVTHNPDGTYTQVIKLRKK